MIKEPSAKRWGRSLESVVGYKIIGTAGSSMIEFEMKGAENDL